MSVVPNNASQHVEEDPIIFENEDPIVKKANEVYNNLFPKGEKIPEKFKKKLTELKQILKNLIGKGKYYRGFPHIYESEINELNVIRNNLNETIYVTKNLDELINKLENINNKSGGRRRCAATRKRSQRKRKATRKRSQRKRKATRRR